MSHPFGTIAGLPEHFPRSYRSSGRCRRARSACHPSASDRAPATACSRFAQALDAGSGAVVRRTLHAGTWQEMAPRVYRAGIAGRLTWLDELAALVLSCDGIAARQSAAALYDLLPPPKKQEILVVRTKRNVERAIVHSTKDLPDSEVVTANGIRATSPVRTVIDTAGDLRASRGLQRPGAARVLRAITSSHPERGAQRMGSADARGSSAPNNPTPRDGRRTAARWICGRRSRLC